MLEFNPKEIHIILLGYDRVTDYYLNLDIIRKNYEFGSDLWITTIYNGGDDKLASGFGENTFIKLDENRGSVGGVIDSINVAGKFASSMSVLRPVTVVMNFDAWFITGDGFKRAVTEFLESGKAISAAVDGNRLPAPDCMMFNVQALNDMLPIDEKVWSVRQNIPELVKKYEPTSLGYENVEEYLLYTLLNVNGLLDKKYEDAETHSNECIDSLLETYWHDMGRDGLPRLEWTDRIKFLHTHDFKAKQQLLKENGTTEGNIIGELLNATI